MFSQIALRSGVVVARSSGCSALGTIHRLSPLLYQSPPKFARFESTQAKPTKAEAIKAKERALSQDPWIPPVITYEQVKPKTQQPSPDSYLIDVREPDEVVQGSIPSSVNVPLSVLSGSLHLPPAQFKAKFGFDKPKRDQEIIFYCRSGVRAATAGDVAKKNGYTNLLNYKGSWLEWVQKEGVKNASS